MNGLKLRLTPTSNLGISTGWREMQCLPQKTGANWNIQDDTTAGRLVTQKLQGLWTGSPEAACV